MRLLYAGQPSQPSAPPVPLQLPPPGHDPCGRQAPLVAVCEPGDTLRAPEPGSGAESDCELTRVRFVGLCAFLALRYRPQALHIIAPVGDLRHNGVLLVPQLLDWRSVSQISPQMMEKHTCTNGLETKGFGLMRNRSTISSYQLPRSSNLFRLWYSPYSSPRPVDRFVADYRDCVN